MQIPKHAQVQIFIMKIFIQSAVLLLFILSPAAAVTLQEYAKLQLKNPASLLQDLLFSDESPTGYFPEIEKLFFLTPWNKKGFEYTIKYAQKIDFVSPCWYTLQLASNGFPAFENQYNYDSNYSTAIKQANPDIKLVPRVYVGGGDFKFFQAIGSDYDKFDKAVGLIARVVAEKGLDGIVWDSPYNLMERERSQLNSLIVQFLKAVRSRLGDGKVIMMNMANPINHMKKLEIDQYNQLPIDHLLIQNYDSGDDYSAMLRSSLEWAKNINPPIKIILMLQFFAVKAKVGPLSTEEAVKSLKRMGVASAEFSKGMCRFNQNKTKRLFLIPCYSYFKQAIDAAKKSQAGVGFWQGGNGLQSYYKFL